MEHEYDLDPFLYTSGPRDARVIIVGEAWGADEERERKPFVGYSGKELDRILFDAGLSRSQCLCTNLVDDRPPANDFTNFLLPGTRDKTGSFLRGVNASPRLKRGYSKLLKLISTVKPKLIIGCGNWPLWALTDHASLSTHKGFRIPSGIMSHRGSQTWSIEIDGVRYPYLPIIHPSAILRQWSLRYVTVQDLRARAARFLDGKRDWTAPVYDFLPDPTFEECRDYLRGWQTRLDQGERLILACDIETWRRTFISVVGFADAERSIAIPFFYFDDTGAMQDVFTADQEYEIVQLIRSVLMHPNLHLTNQNFSYDFQFLERWFFIKPIPKDDTMLMQHLLWPGTPKSLEYIASLYCDHYVYWKDESQDWDGTPGGHLQMWQYNCKDTRYTYDAAVTLRSLIEKLNMTDLLVSQMEQWELAAQMYLDGVNWAHKRCQEMRRELRDEANRLTSYMLNCMPEDIRYAPSGKPWYTSTSHQQWIFYDLLGIEPILHKKTKRPTLDKESFERLKDRAPWLGPLLDKLKLYRSIEVFERNFLSARPGPDGRMHSSFNVGGTETFRWSSSQNAFGEGLNLQNIPAERD